MAVFYIISFFILFAHSCCAQTSSQLEEIEAKCKKEVPLTSNDYVGDNLSKNAKCYLKCLFEGVGVIKNGNLDKVNFLNTINATMGEEMAIDDVYDITSECFTKNPSSKSTCQCEVSYALYKCLFSMVEKIFWVLSFEADSK